MLCMNLPCRNRNKWCLPPTDRLTTEKDDMPGALNLFQGLCNLPYRGVSEPHKVPGCNLDFFIESMDVASRIDIHGLQNCSCIRSDPSRMDTLCMRKYRSEFHACGFLVATTPVSEPIRESIGMTGIVEDDTRSDSAVLRFSSGRSVLVLPIFGGFAVLNGSKVLLRVERWFFTSDFFMRLIITPVVLLLAWKVLVWSKA